MTSVTIAGGGSVGGIASGFNDGLGTVALFNVPIRIAIDSLGIGYVADSGNNVIRKVDTSGNIVIVIDYDLCSSYIETGSFNVLNCL